MALDFPTNPSIGQVYTYGDNSWQWNGYAWDLVSDTAPNLGQMGIWVGAAPPSSPVTYSTWLASGSGYWAWLPIP